MEGELAADWIKVLEDLHEKPEILKIASAMKTRPEHVVGYCCRFWGWVSRNCVPDLSLENGDTCPQKTGTPVPENLDTCPDSVPVDVSIESIELVIGLPGFLKHLVNVGWLYCREEGDACLIVIPKIDRHLSEGAKTRALASEKKRLQRRKNVPKKQGHLSPKNRDTCPQKTGTREEKRREEVKKKESKPKNPRFVAPTVDEVRAYCQERSNGVDPQRFLDHYEANGWVRGKTKIQDWQACVRTWEQNNRPVGTTEPDYVTDFEERNK